jgi:hypothetical protein
MALKEHPNEWEGIPKEQVIDWLDHPCTRFMRSQITRGLGDYDAQAIALVNGNVLPAGMLETYAGQIRVAKLALNQSLNILKTAEHYVKG